MSKEKEKPIPYPKYEKVLDDPPRMEGNEGFVVGQEGQKVRIPFSAYVHETGDSIQLNCCLTPWCKNFGVGGITEDNGSPSKPPQLAPNYSVQIRDEMRKQKKTGRKFTALQCDLCGYWTKIYSNRSVGELINLFIRKYAPSIICDGCTDNESDGSKDKSRKEYYADPSPNDFFGSNGYYGPTRAKRLVCKNCGRTRNPFWNRCPRDFADMQNKPEKYINAMHATSQLSVNDFRRSHVYGEREIPENEPYNPNLYDKFYNALGWYQFFAVEWIGYYNNQIRFGKAKTEYTPKPKPVKKKSSDKDGEKDSRVSDDDYPTDEPYTEEEGMFESLPKDITDKDIPYFCMPQVQTDTLLLSTHTPGSKDKRQELRLMLSVLVPSGYILLATLNYSEQHNLSELSRIDHKANRFLKLKIQGIDRELCLHAHKDRQTDRYYSRDRTDGRKVIYGFENRGACIRHPYHALAHYYTLEKIVAGIPELMLVQDGEAKPYKACLWAFRRRIAEKSCHVIMSIGEKKGDISLRGGKNRMTMKRLKDLTNGLKKDIDKAKAKFDRSKGIQSNRVGFQSRLFAQGKDGTNIKKKVVLTADSLAEMDSMNAAMMLRGASLFMVDSVCNQIRYRVRGLFRGKKTAKNKGLNYVSHWKNPMRVQQLADIFTFSSNCLEWHSVQKGYSPATDKLEISICRHRHLIHHIVSPEITSDEFVRDKFRLS